MKKLTVLCWFVLLFAALSACDSGDNIDEALVGEWLRESTYNWTYIFNEDGTGERGAVEIQTFTWSVIRDDRVLLDFAGFRNQTWYYTIDGPTLNMIHRGNESENINYFRVDHSADVVGIWAWPYDESLQFVFEADGTGTHNFAGYTSSFYWFTARENLIIDHGPHEPNEHWHFAVTDDNLTIDSRQIAGLTRGYTRVN